MHSKQELIQLLSGDWHDIDFNNRALQLVTQPDTIPLLVNLTKHTDNKIAWRSAYLLDKIHDQTTEIVVPYLAQVIEIAETTKNPSVRRHYFRMLTQHNLSQKVSGNFVDLCFQLLYEEKTKIAVKAHAMQLLYNLTKGYPELASELKVSLQELLPNASSGVKNRAKKLLAKL